MSTIARRGAESSEAARSPGPPDAGPPDAGPPPAADPPDAQPAPLPGAATYRVLGALSIVTGLLHAKALVDHASHYWPFGVFFGVLMTWQTVWGVRAFGGRLSRRGLVAGGAYVSLAVVAVWLVSRTVGLPIGPWAGEPEAIGFIDLMASVDELAITAIVAALVSAPPPRGLAWLRGGYAVRLGVMLASASLFATTVGGHTH